MRGDDTCFIGHFQLGELSSGVLHRFPIGLAAHDNPDQRFLCLGHKIAAKLLPQRTRRRRAWIEYPASLLTVPPIRCGGFTLSPQRGEGRGEGWEIRWAQTSPSSALELNHPSPSISLPIEGRGKSRIRLHSIFRWKMRPSQKDITPPIRSFIWWALVMLLRHDGR